MAILVNGICGLLLFLAVSQLLLVFFFARTLWNFRSSPLSDERCGAALVVLALRGGDPFLGDCVSALLQQDYPQFDIRIVIDGKNDPAWAIVEKVLAKQNAKNVQVEPLENRRPNCSLKCSSMLQAVADLDSQYDFVAQLDADTVPHSSWLRELAGALDDASVGAATGNRWYFPAEATWGSLVRYLWNAAAVVQMYVYGIAWGGTLAVKAELLEAAGLRDRWGRAFCEDTMISAALRPLGLKVAFVPALMMVNRESCTLNGYEQWVRRQLLTARLYHPYWPAVAGHGAITTVALGMALLVAGVSLIQERWWLLLVSLAGYLFYQVGMALSLWIIEYCVRRIAASRGEPTNWLSATGLLKCCAAIPLTQLLYPRSLWAAVNMGSVTWRGVHYDIAGPWRIRLVGDQGLQQSTTTSDSTESLS